MLVPLHSPVGLASKKPLLEGKFRHKKHDLLAGHAYLYVDRLVLEDPAFMRNSPDVISLKDIDWVLWIPSIRRDTNIQIRISKGKSIKLYLDSPGLWKYELQEQCARLGNHAPLNKRWKGLWKRIPACSQNEKPRENIKINSKIIPISDSEYTSPVPRPEQPTTVRKFLNVTDDYKVTQWLSSMGYLVRDATPTEILAMLATEANNWGLSVGQLISVVVQDDNIFLTAERKSR